MAGGLGAANNLSALAQRAGYKLPGGASGTLGDANSAYQLYNAFKNPGVGSAVAGLGGAANLYKQAGGSLPAGAGAALGDLGYGAGIYNAIKNPSAGNLASGAYDAYKLYSSLSGGGAGLGAAVASLGPLAAVFGIGSLLSAPEMMPNGAAAKTADGHFVFPTDYKSSDPATRARYNQWKAGVDQHNKQMEAANKRGPQATNLV